MHAATHSWVTAHGLKILEKNQADLRQWGHKTDARAGDTIYLRHGDHIRAVLLAAGCDADPVNGKISVASPIGSALVGRHAGDTVRLNTLDGRLDYQILKIV